jgi:hypothetical protein
VQGAPDYIYDVDPGVYAIDPMLIEATSAQPPAAADPSLFSSLPVWMPWAAAGAALLGLVYVVAKKS